jgi:hypothetical protein
MGSHSRCGHDGEEYLCPFWGRRPDSYKPIHSHSFLCALKLTPAVAEKLRGLLCVQIRDIVRNFECKEREHFQNVKWCLNLYSFSVLPAHFNLLILCTLHDTCLFLVTLSLKLIQSVA